MRITERSHTTCVKWIKHETTYPHTICLSTIFPLSILFFLHIWQPFGKYITYTWILHFNPINFNDLHRIFLSLHFYGMEATIHHKTDGGPRSVKTTPFFSSLFCTQYFHSCRVKLVEDLKAYQPSVHCLLALKTRVSTSQTHLSLCYWSRVRSVVQGFLTALIDFTAAVKMQFSPSHAKRLSQTFSGTVHEMSYRQILDALERLFPTGTSICSRNVQYIWPSL